MKSFDQLAQSAYAAYVKQASGRTLNGLPLLTWERLSDEHKACWIAAAKQLWAEFAAIH